MRLIDLSHTVGPHWRWRPELTQTRRHADGDLFQVTLLRTTVHAFTHVDAPLHFVPGAPDIAALPLETFAGEAAVVDLSHLGPNGAVTAAELERHAGQVRAGDIALLRTDWDRRRDIGTREFWTEAPYVARDGAEWLLARGIRALGTDFPPDEVLRRELTDSAYRSRAEENTTHDVLLRGGVHLIEYLANLAALTEPRVLFLALPLKLAGADGSPVRAVALQLG